MVEQITWDNASIIFGHWNPFKVRWTFLFFIGPLTYFPVWHLVSLGLHVTCVCIFSVLLSTVSENISAFHISLRLQDFFLSNCYTCMPACLRVISLLSRPLPIISLMYGVSGRDTALFLKSCELQVYFTSPLFFVYVCWLFYFSLPVTSLCFWLFENVSVLSYFKRA